MTESRIVVGVDGSDASKDALRWALHQARLTGATVDAVIAWQPVVVFGYVPPVGDFDVANTARAVLGEAVASVVTEGENVRQTVVEGVASRVLVDAAKDAALLVVGNRGHAGITEALLGSVGQYCVHHASCPVVVVR